MADQTLTQREAFIRRVTGESGGFRDVFERDVQSVEAGRYPSICHWNGSYFLEAAESDGRRVMKARAIVRGVTDDFGNKVRVFEEYSWEVPV